MLFAPLLLVFWSLNDVFVKVEAVCGNRYFKISTLNSINVDFCFVEHFRSGLGGRGAGAVPSILVATLLREVTPGPTLAGRPCYSAVFNAHLPFFHLV